MSADKRFPGWVRHAGVGLELAGAVAGFALIGYWIDSAVRDRPVGPRRRRDPRARRRPLQPRESSRCRLCTRRSRGRGGAGGAPEEPGAAETDRVGVARAPVRALPGPGAGDRLRPDGRRVTCRRGAWPATRRFRRWRSAAASVSPSAALAGWLLTAVRADDAGRRECSGRFWRWPSGSRSSSCWGSRRSLSGEFARMPLLFWMATTYVVLLPLEVKLAIAE